MSQNYNKLDTVLVLDPRVKIDNDRPYAVVKSGTRITPYKWTTVSVSNQSINWTLTPPSNNIIVGRRRMLTMPVRLTFRMLTQPGQRAVIPGCIAARSWPLHSIIQSFQCTLNNCGFSYNSAELIHPQSRFYNVEETATTLHSMSPCAPDNCQNYGDLYGSIRNVLSQNGDTTNYNVVGRGGFAGMTIVSNPVNNTPNPAEMTVVIDFLFTECIMVPPYDWKGVQDVSGFFNLTQETININLIAQAGNRIISVNNTPESTFVINSGSIQLSNFQAPSFSYYVNQPYIQLDYITPDPVITKQISNGISFYNYNYSETVQYETPSNNAISFGQSAVIVSNNIQLSTVPSFFYIYVRPSNNYLYADASLTDCFYKIENVSIEFMNQTGLLSQVSMEQLYAISVRNGLSGVNYSDWIGEGMYQVGGSDFSQKYYGVGSIIALNTALDLSTGEIAAVPGMGSNANFRVTLNIRNINASGTWDNVNYSLYVAVVTEGVFTIVSSDSAIKQTSVLNQSDVILAQQAPDVDYTDVLAADGSGFDYNKLKKYANQAKNAAMKTNKFLKDSKIISRGTDALSYALPGYSADIARGISDISSKYGYGVEGGAMMDRRKLQQRLQNR